MGASNFDTIQVLKGDANDAYDQACLDARDYNGHQDGYSGDIQTTSGFRMATDHPRYGTKAFWEWEDDMLESRLEKRGHCLCVEIKGVELKKRKNYHHKGKRGIRGFYFFGWGAE